MSTAPPIIGILALQGDFEVHRKALEQSGGRVKEVRAQSDFAQIDGLIIPGGESTTMLKLMNEEKLFEPVRQFGLSKPVFGTCAGAILLARRVLNPEQQALGLMDMTVERNAYGRQIDSRIVQLSLDGQPLEAVFIRAPVILNVCGSARVLITYDGDPVLVEEGMHLAATFHPELANDFRIHRRFVEKVAVRAGQNSVAIAPDFSGEYRSR
ncbi:MAG TPA: pyridoxal 5'-phosphate synthase glutaminase subunit PdxT [Bryobacteraceae bacterium]|nr:pyridoxal 5'-phosphate synthase glutaminase subunit PdxT [Bryobacteraceae bacterium]